MNKFIVKVGLNDKELECAIKSNGKIVNLGGFYFKLNKKNNIYRLSLKTKRKDKIKWIGLRLPISKELFGPNTYFYDDSFGTNAQTKILKQIENIGHFSGQVIVYKNLDNNITFGCGFIEANRFFESFVQKNKSCEISIDMENKSLNEDEEYFFERFILSKNNENTLKFLDRYGRLVKKTNNIKFPHEIPNGFCSWSRYYSNINETKIYNEIKYTYEYLKDKEPNIIQLDDGWQVFGSFPGKYEVDKTKFPNGLKNLIRETNNKNMKFGLWFAPTIVDANAPKFDEIKDLVCFNNKIDCLGNNIYAFDFDNPKFFEYLKEQFNYYSKTLGIKYMKIDFLEHPFTHGYYYNSDYKIALFKKGLQAIRDGVGEDVLLVGCTGFVLPFAGIFNINRITCDIIWGKKEFPTYYNLIKLVSKTIFYRYFYNYNLQINDPDGVVVRNYDVGDYFNASLGEAKIIPAMILCSGGSTLHNEDLTELNNERLNLIKRLTPSIGKSARPLDFFELEGPTIVFINRLKTKNPYVLISLFNFSEEKDNKEICISKFGIDKGIIINSFDNKILGISDKINITIPAHSAEILIIVPIPEKPQFLCSDINYTLGRELFYFKNNKIYAKKKTYLKYLKYVYVPNGFNITGKEILNLDIGKVIEII